MCRVIGLSEPVSECFHYMSESRPYLWLEARVSEAASLVWNHIKAAGSFVGNIASSCRNSITSYCKSCLSSIVARYVLYSLNELTGTEYKERAALELTRLTQAGSTATATRFVTSDQTTLSVASIVHPENKNPDKKTIVYFPRNFEIWQMSVSYLKCLHNETHADIHAINYRHTGGSNGFPEVEDPLIRDGVDYVHDLLHQGIPADKIVLFGDDVGAAVATKVAACLAEENHDVNIVSVRGYRSLTAMIRAVFPVAANFVANLAAKLDWKLDVEADLPSLKGRFICMYSEHDPLIPAAVGVKAALETTNLQVEYIAMNELQFAQDFPALAEDADCNPHIRPFTATEHEHLIAAINRVWE